MIRQRGIQIRKPCPPPEGLFCLYPHRSCMQNKLDGYDYCSKHILEDKNSTYKQCNFISGKTGKRCSSAASKSDKKDGFCLEHVRLTQRNRQKASKKPKPRETPETLLEQIEHYGSKADNARDLKRGRNNHHDHFDFSTGDGNGWSDSESEQLVENCWRGDADSDAESVDSEQEDPLKHAGIYTAEEVSLITKDKLIRLQSLYIEQFKRLQHVMQEKRRKFIHKVKLERESLGSIHASKEDPEQREQYEKLTAMKRYHKRYGREALLHRQSKERRIAASEGANYKPPSYPKCQQVTGKGKCLARAVPLSKFCLNHVLSDQGQILYRPCVFGNGVCNRPAAQLSKNQLCERHISLLPSVKRYPPDAEDAQVDDKEPIDVVNEDLKIYATQQPRQVIIKTELVEAPASISHSMQTINSGHPNQADSQINKVKSNEATLYS